MKKILSMILLLCAAFSVQLRAEEVFTAGSDVYIQGGAANAGTWATTADKVQKMNDAGNGVYTWTGDLTEGTFRFLCEFDENNKNNWNLMSWEAEANNT